ncbi:hypothetical protein MTO96_049026 [Rhipicephalus appendiculatus]
MDVGTVVAIAKLAVWLTPCTTIGRRGAEQRRFGSRTCRGASCASTARRCRPRPARPAGAATDDFLAEMVEDNAVLEPLYRVYVRSFPLRGGQPALFRLPTLRYLSTDELFFVNFALGQCDQPAAPARNGTAARQVLFRERLPAKFKVNVPLSNSEHFARVYGCKKGSPMNPVRSCSVWTATG